MKNGQSFKYWLMAQVRGIPYWPRHGWERILHFWKWFPILWNDHDWDYIYLYIIIKHKLKLMRENHEKNQIIADWKHAAYQIKIAELCLGRLIKNEYINKDWEEHEKKFGSILDRKLIKSKDGTSMRMTTFSLENTKDVRRIGKKEEELIKQDLETFARLFIHHSRTWWD